MKALWIQKKKDLPAFDSFEHFSRYFEMRVVFVYCYQLSARLFPVFISRCWVIESLNSFLTFPPFLNKLIYISRSLNFPPFRTLFLSFSWRLSIVCKTFVIFYYQYQNNLLSFRPNRLAVFLVNQDEKKESLMAPNVVFSWQIHFYNTNFFIG